VLVRSFLILVAIAIVGYAGIDTAFGEASIVRDLPPGLQVPDAAKPQPGFDVDRATEAWLALLSPEQRQLSDTYFEGRYWLQFWELVYSVGVLALLLFAGWSKRMRELAERLSRRRFLSAMIYAALFLAANFVLSLPFLAYARFWREHQYGLSNLSFPGWLREQLIGLAVTLFIGSVVLALLSTAIRRTGARWWVWATGLAFVVTLFLDLVEPVFDRSSVAAVRRIRIHPVESDAFHNDADELADFRFAG